MADKSAKAKETGNNCWEFWDCPKKKREKCPVYKANAGKFCWFFEDLFSPKSERCFKKCWECPWYQFNLKSEK